MLAVKLSEKCKWLILQLPTVTPLSARLLLSVTVLLNLGGRAPQEGVNKFAGGEPLRSAA